jgi:integrase
MAVHLNPPGLDGLHAIPRFEGHPYVICGEEPARHLVEQPRRRIRKAAKLDDVTHDLRHTFEPRTSRRSGEGSKRCDRDAHCCGKDGGNGGAIIPLAKTVR